MKRDFRERTFQKPVVRLIKILARTKGSYTFEAFAYEDDVIRQFNIRFLPDRPYYAINFVKSKEPLQKGDEDVLRVAEAIKDIFYRFRDQWEGKKSIEELTQSFVAMLIDTQPIKVPETELKKIETEIIRIFNNPDVVKMDVKGRPYFTNAQFGKFFITDVGNIDMENLSNYNLSL